MASFNVYAQYAKDSVIQYFDRSWKQIDPKKQRSEYFRIAKKLEDGTWHVKDCYAVDPPKLQMEGIYLDDSFKIEHGRFYYYHSNGNIRTECTYYKGEYVGLYRAYSHKGELLDSTRYKSTGTPFGKSFQWDGNNKLKSYAEYDMEGKGTGSETGFWSDSSISYFGKYTEGHLKDSVWTYYHKNGKISMQETYSAGSVTGYSCYDLNGLPIDDCDTATKMPEPQYDVNRFLGENIRMPREPMEMGLYGEARVQILFIVDTDGKLKDFEVTNRILDVFSEEALRVVRKLGPWRPAKHKNRNVPVWYTLPVNFRIG